MEAKDIYSVCEEKKICEILALRSFKQLVETFKEYLKISGVDILETIESKIAGKLKKALIAIGKS